MKRHILWIMGVMIFQNMANASRYNEEEDPRPLLFSPVDVNALSPEEKKELAKKLLEQYQTDKLSLSQLEDYCLKMVQLVGEDQNASLQQNKKDIQNTLVYLDTIEKKRKEIQELEVKVDPFLLFMRSKELISDNVGFYQAVRYAHFNQKPGIFYLVSYSYKADDLAECIDKICDLFEPLRTKITEDLASYPQSDLLITVDDVMDYIVRRDFLIFRDNEARAIIKISSIISQYLQNEPE